VGNVDPDKGQRTTQRAACNRGRPGASAACGQKAEANRSERDVFRCAPCGHEAHADHDASIIIARRGVQGRPLKKRAGWTPFGDARHRFPP